MRSTTKESTSAWNIAAVRDFATGYEDILVLERNPLRNLGSTLQDCRVHEYWAMIRNNTVAKEVRNGLEELQIQSSEMETDIVGLAKAFIDQFGLQKAKLRIEATRTQSCPKFHCDNLHVRMITTYLGPTTEYHYIGESVAQSAPSQALVFLKGRKCATHRGTVLHRSPPVLNGQMRLCVAIDY